MIPTNGLVSNRVLKLNVGFLLSQGIGSTHAVDFAIPAIAVADDLRLGFLTGQLRLSRTHEGILVQGQLHTAVDGECRRCLAEISIAIDLDLEELFTTHPGPGNRIQFKVDDTAVLDLTPLLREEVFLHIPLAPLCKADCAGLCPQCGKDLNEGPCTCERDEIDPRLAVLMQLRNQK